MSRKSITQEYYVLAVDKNGYMAPMHKDESNAGIVVAGFMDLLLNEVVAEEDKKITVIAPLPDELSHLATLYDYLKAKPCTVKKMIVDFYEGNTSARIKQLTTQLGESLIADNIATEGKGGLFGPKTTYIPEKDYKDEVIEVIKSAVLTDNEMIPHDVVLVCILMETKNLNQYFSKHEYGELSTKLKEMKKDPQNKQLGYMVNYIGDMITQIISWIQFHVLNQ